MEHSDVIVIGGGLAGLAAAATAARQGATVVLLEARSELGGRAATDERDGFLLNLGPHALYLAGAGREVLAGFGIDPPGGFPQVEAWASDGDVVGPLPADARTLVRTPLLGWPAKVAWARLASSLRTLDVGPLAGVTLADWLDARGAPRLGPPSGGAPRAGLVLHQRTRAHERRCGDRAAAPRPPGCPLPRRRLAVDRGLAAGDRARARGAGGAGRGDLASSTTGRRGPLSPGAAHGVRRPWSSPPAVPTSPPACSAWSRGSRSHLPPRPRRSTSVCAGCPTTPCCSAPTGRSTSRPMHRRRRWRPAGSSCRSR